MIVLIFTLVTVFGCAATGENLKSNVYKSGQVNTSQAARTIKITAVLPAQIEVDNSKFKKLAIKAAGLLGVLAGLAVGFDIGGAAIIVGTTVGGGAVGVAAGSMLADKVLVEGVSIAYLENRKMFTSAQVGKLCEFKANATAVIISTGPKETRIQPNATCPVEK